MRLFPAASSIRRGEPSFTITDPRNSLHYPADQSTLIDLACPAWVIPSLCEEIIGSYVQLRNALQVLVDPGYGSVAGTQ